MSYVVNSWSLLGLLTLNQHCKLILKGYGVEVWRLVNLTQIVIYLLNIFFFNAFFLLLVTHQGFDPSQQSGRQQMTHGIVIHQPKIVLCVRKRMHRRCESLGKGRWILAPWADWSCTLSRTHVPSRPLGLLPFSCRVVPLCLDTDPQLPIPALHSGTVCSADPYVLL